MRTLKADTLQAYVPHTHHMRRCHTYAELQMPLPRRQSWWRRPQRHELYAELGATSASSLYGDKYLGAMNHDTEMCYFGVIICDTDP